MDEWMNEWTWTATKVWFFTFTKQTKSIWYADAIQNEFEFLLRNSRLLVINVNAFISNFTAADDMKWIALHRPNRCCATHIPNGSPPDDTERTCDKSNRVCCRTTNLTVYTVNSSRSEWKMRVQSIYSSCIVTRNWGSFIHKIFPVFQWERCVARCGSSSYSLPIGCVNATQSVSVWDCAWANGTRALRDILCV